MSNAAFTLDDRRLVAIDRPRAYRKVRRRRMIGFVLDYTFVLLLSIPAAALVGVFGILTLGLGWMLYAVLLPLVAILYVGLTMGGRAQATPGMALAGVRLVRRDGVRIDPVFATLHAVLFWASNAVLTPFVLLIALLTPRKQLLQDLLLNTVVVRR